MGVEAVGTKEDFVDELGGPEKSLLGHGLKEHKEIGQFVLPQSVEEVKHGNGIACGCCDIEFGLENCLLARDEIAGQANEELIRRHDGVFSRSKTYQRVVVNDVFGGSEYLHIIPVVGIAIDNIIVTAHFPFEGSGYKEWLVTALGGSDRVDAI